MKRYKATKLYVEVELKESYTHQYAQALVGLAKNTSQTGRVFERYSYLYFIYNGQLYDGTSGYNLSKRVVEIDISSVSANTEWYLGLIMLLDKKETTVLLLEQVIFSMLISLYKIIKKLILLKKKATS